MGNPDLGHGFNGAVRRRTRSGATAAASRPVRRPSYRGTVHAYVAVTLPSGTAAEAHPMRSDRGEDGDHLIVVLNGTKTLDVHDSKFLDGRIRLQYQKFPIEFKNIKLKLIKH